MATKEFVKELMDNDDFKNMMKSVHEDTTKMIKNLLDNHTKRMEEMEMRHLKKVEKMESEHRAKMEQVEGRISEIEETQQYRMQTVEDSIQKMKESHTRRIEQLEGQIHSLSCENIALKKQNESNEEQSENLLWNTENIASVLEDQIQYSRRNCLVVSGIAEQRGENTDEIIKSFAAEKLGIELDHTDIDRSHRLGKKQVGKPRGIIVKFVRYNVRHKFLKERRKLRGQKMGIQELLTPYTEHLLGKAKDLSQKAPWLKKVWTWDGRVVCLVQLSESHPEQKVTVRNIEDLNKIWLKGGKSPPKSSKAKRRLTDPDYEKAQWEKVEKRD